MENKKIKWKTLDDLVNSKIKGSRSGLQEKID